VLFHFFGIQKKKNKNRKNVLFKIEKRNYFSKK
jgi:hypothetical protein